MAETTITDENKVSTATLVKTSRVKHSLIIVVGATFFLSLLFGYKNYIQIHSDSLFFPSLYKDLFEDGNSWSGWSLSPAPYYFPDMAGYFLIRFFVHDVFLSFLFSSVIQFVGLILSFLYLYKGLHGKLTDQVIMITLLLASLVYYFNSLPHFPFFQYSFTIVSHTGALISTLLCSGLIIRFLKRSSPYYLLSLFLLCFLMVLSDKLFVIIFVLPAMASLTILFCINQLSRRALFYLGMAVILSSLLATKLVPLTNPYITRNSSIYISTGLSQARLQKTFVSIEGFINDLKTIKNNRYNFYYLISLLSIICIMLMSAPYYLFVLTSKGKDAQISGHFFFLMLCLIAIPLSVLSVIVLGIYSDLWHYFNFMIVPFFYLPILLSNKEGLIYRGINVKAKDTLLLSCASITLSVMVINTPFKGSKFEFYPEMAQCLDKHKEQYQLSNGLSDYWNSRINTMFSKTGIWINQIGSDGNPWHWLNNIEWYENIKNYNFVILERLNKDKILKKFGEPSASFLCKDIEVIVYGEKNNIEKIIESNGLISGARFARTGKFVAEAPSLPSNIGTVVGTDRIARESDGAGYLIFGPYLNLSKGKYKFTLTYSARADIQPIASWDIGAFATSDKVNLKSGEITVKNAEKETLSSIIELSRKLDLIEFRLFYHGKGDLTVHTLNVEKI